VTLSLVCFLGGGGVALAQDCPDHDIPVPGLTMHEQAVMIPGFDQVVCLIPPFLEGETLFGYPLALAIPPLAPLVAHPEAFTDSTLRGLFLLASALGMVQPEHLARFEDQVSTTWLKTPIASLADVPRPRDFPDEPIAELNGRTTLVELDVPRSAYDRQVLGDEVGPVKLRGWYIRGVRPASLGPAPLFLILHQHGVNPFSTEPAIDFGGNVAPAEFHGALRLLAYHAAMSGFDVLLYSLRGHGVSDGESAHEGPASALDVFRVLEAMSTGGGMTTSPPRAEPWRASSAAGRDVVLWGFSQGSHIAQRVMALAFSGAGGEAAMLPPGTRIRGAILIGSLLGSAYHYGSVADAVTDGALRVLYEASNFAVPDADALTSVARWPGLLILQSTHDSGTIKGAVDLFNHARGLKEIHTILGIHGEHFLPEHLSLTITRSVTFAQRLVMETPVDDATQTTVEDQVREALEAAAAD